MREPVKVPTLSERIARRAEETPPQKGTPVILKIIEVRGEIAKQRLLSRSWAYLIGILKAEGVHLSQGTLRNYMHKIGRAEAALKDKGVLSPTDAEVHAVLWRARAKKPITSAPSPRPQQAKVAKEAGKQSHVSPLPASSLTRNPKREL